MRSMSCMYTVPQVVMRSKIVTRRLGWLKLKPDDLLKLVVKAMGLRKGERQQPLAIVIVVDVRREPLNAITAEDVVAEGFPDLTPEAFVAMFRRHMRCAADQIVTRIEWRYLPGGRFAGRGTSTRNRRKSVPPR